MDENVLSNEEIQKLRALGVLTESEIATRQGDLLVAVDVISQTRRIIESSSVQERVNSKRLLRG